MTRIAILAFEGISPFHLSVPCMVFGDAPDTRIAVCALTPGMLGTNAGFDIRVTEGLAVLAASDIVIIPSWPDPGLAAPAVLLDALRAARARGATLVGLCLGAFVLAEAGLLDGRSATTHWAAADVFAQRFPVVAFDPDVLYIGEDRLWTSAGTAAGIDCCLQMVREERGADAANALARRLVVPPHRQGGQAQFIPQPLPAHPADARLAQLLDSVRARLAAPHTLDSLAQEARMSRRTFTRHFRALTGCTVGEWLRHERLARCQRLLETTRLPIERIAEETGFGSPLSLRQHFRKACGVTPAQWRSSFGTRT